MSPRFWIAVGAALAATAVAAGAIGAHALRDRLDPRQFESYETAVRFQLFHAVALVVIGALGAALPGPKWSIPGWLFLFGALLFSGGIYGWLLTGARALVHITPVGGVGLIAGWVALAVVALRRN